MRPAVGCRVRSLGDHGMTMEDAEQRAQHLVRAANGPDEAVAAAIEEGATLARARGAPETAAELAEAATRLTPPEQADHTRRRLVAAGYHRVTAGEIHRGREHMAAAVARMTAGPERAEIQWRLAMLTFLDGGSSRCRSGCVV
jgi:hypothetical protein